MDKSMMATPGKHSGELWEGENGRPKVSRFVKTRQERKNNPDVCDCKDGDLCCCSCYGCDTVNDPNGDSHDGGKIVDKV